MYRNASSLYQTLIAYWNGTAWGQVASPTGAPRTPTSAAPIPGRMPE